jgi:hypothetical protein
MFAPDHERAAGELVRVCRPGGRVEPQGRWPEFVQAFADLIRRFNLACGVPKIGSPALSQCAHRVS